jgi:CxxC motif-containing protein
MQSMDAEGLDEQVLQFTCVICPLGCRLKVQVKNGEIVSIKGNQCPRGIIYARNEIRPKRTLMSVLKVVGGDWPVVSVKTSEPIPKEMIPEAMNALSKVVVRAPVTVGEKIVEDFLGLKINVVATRNVNHSENR